MSGGRGAGGGSGGYPSPGYVGPEYGDDGYGRNGTPPGGGEPQWDDSVWQRDQPDAWPAQDPGSAPGAQQGYDPQGYDPQAYARRSSGVNDSQVVFSAVWQLSRTLAISRSHQSTRCAGSDRYCSTSTGSLSTV